MDEYIYRGYTITETSDGYYAIGDMEFPSYDEACDWVDAELESTLETEEDLGDSKKIHTYIIYYIADNRAYETPVEAPNIAEAKKVIWRDYDPDANILDWYAID